MAPRITGTWTATDPEPSPYRSAAGLLLIFPRDGQAHILLTVRSQQVRHGGQVSMPGGVIESGESIVDAALREAREEVALADTDVQVLGQLSPIDIAVSGFRLHPVVATVKRAPALTASDGEVARILEVPVSVLLDPTRIEYRSMTRGTIPLIAPAFVIEHAVIWGATAMVLAELLALAGWPGPPMKRS